MTVVKEDRNSFEKETLAQVFSCEFYKTFLEHLFHKTPPGDYFWTFTKLFVMNSRVNLISYTSAFFKSQTMK